MKTPPKRRRAAALRYTPGKDRAPKVAAKGSGAVAEHIIRVAREHGIPVKEDPDLMAVLAGLDIEQEIPADLYLAVAELLAFVYSLNGKKKPGYAFFSRRQPSQPEGSGSCRGFTPNRPQSSGLGPARRFWRAFRVGGSPAAAPARWAHKPKLGADSGRRPARLGPFRGRPHDSFAPAAVKILTHSSPRRRPAVAGQAFCQVGVVAF